MIKPTILLIDDNKNIHSALGFVFEDDYNLLHAFSFKDVKDLITATFEVVILDNYFDSSEYNGLDIFRYIVEYKKDVGVILFSAFLTNEIIKQFKNEKIKYFLHKPADKNDMLAVVKKALNKG